MRGVGIIVAVASLLALFPGAAQAEKFTGRTEQGKLVQLWTHPNGKVRAIAFRWHTQDCDNGTRMKTRKTGFIQPFKRQNANNFFDHVNFGINYTDADVDFVSTVTGKLAPGGWRGRFKVEAHIDFDSGVSDDCRLGPITWSVPL